MKRNAKILVAVVLGLAITMIGCGKTTGACTSGGLEGTCANGFTIGECDSANGTFQAGQTCQDLGFRVTDGSENTTAGSITGVS